MKRLRWLLLLLVLPALGWQRWARAHPEAFFPHGVTRGTLQLWSDEPFAGDHGQAVLELVETKLKQSTLYDPQLLHRAWICNAGWRQRVFLPAGQALGGVNYYPLTDNVFLGSARVYSNRVVSPEGWTVGGARTLDYYITHEMTHTLVGHRAGGFGRVPVWLNEGYADFIGLGPSFTHERALNTWQRRNPAHDKERSGQYLRYDVMVAWLLEREGKRIEELLDHPPAMADVERRCGLSQ